MGRIAGKFFKSVPYMDAYQYYNQGVSTIQFQDRVSGVFGKERMLDTLTGRLDTRKHRLSSIAIVAA